MAKNQFGVEQGQYAPNEQNIFRRGALGFYNAFKSLPTGQDITNQYGQGGQGSILAGTKATPAGGTIPNPFALGGNVPLGPEGYSGVDPSNQMGSNNLPVPMTEQIGKANDKAGLMQMYDPSKYLKHGGHASSGNLPDDPTVLDSNINEFGINQDPYAPNENFTPVRSLLAWAKGLGGGDEDEEEVPEEATTDEEEEGKKGGGFDWSVFKDDNTQKTLNIKALIINGC
jgi:hypothetical protein